MRRAQWFAIAIFLIAASVYLPTLDDPALNWDDPEYIELPLLQQPDALAQIWTSFATPQVYPVVFTSFWIDTLLWKGDLRGTRAVDLLLHGLVGVLAFCFLRSILGRRFGEGPAFVTALLFALHPTQVATVAWIAERKNLLAAIFVLLALMACRRATMRADGRPARREWTAAYVFGFLAMFSKSTAVVLPLLVLWMEAWIPARRPAAADVGGSGRWRSLLLRMLPFFAFAALQSGLTTFREHGPAVATDVTLVQRLAVAARAVWFYWGKLVWPTGLSPMYTRWSPDGSLLAFGAIAVAGLLLLAGILVWLLRSRRMRDHEERRQTLHLVVFSLGFFLLASLPTLGIVPFGYMEKSFVADHFLYLPALGFWTAVAAVALHVTRAGSRGSQARTLTVSVTVAGILLAGAFGILSIRRLPHWSGTEALWTRAIQTSPSAWAAWNNRGEVRARDGRWQEARDDLEQALTIRSDYPEARFNLGYVLDRQGDLAGARREYERAVAISPNFAEAHLNLGLVLARQGDPLGTRREIDAARALDPSIPVPPSLDQWLRDAAPSGRDPR